MGSVMLPPALAVFSVSSDARYLYFGSANGQGLYRYDYTFKSDPQQLIPGSIWEIDVLDDVIVYGEHGASAQDTSPAVGSIYVIEK